MKFELRNGIKQTGFSFLFAAACFQPPHKGSVVTDPNKTNVLGSALASCSNKTGYYRDGYCASGPDDLGVHVVCAEVTKEFLEFSKSRGNDLITPITQYGFKGLKPGDRWCLCASRWKEAFDAKVAPPVILEATHSKALEFATLEQLKSGQIACLK